MENSIAIVGTSCRMPSANNMEEFWDILSQGIDAIVPRPKDRPGMTRGEQQTIGTATPIEAGFLKCHVDEFDAKFFGVSPREAVFMDPQQRILLEVAWESLENAGINPLELKGSDASVFVGIWMQDYSELIPIRLSSEKKHHRYSGNAFSATASKISYFLGLHGHNTAVESGCSSFTAGLHLACESLRRGETSLALSGGVNIILGDGAALSYVLSKDRRCKTFDESADGFVRAEACGMLVLKRFADAVNDRNKIHAVIRGSAVSNDGSGTSFGTPNAAAQEWVIRRALKNAGIKPSEVNFIEAHGTGTAVGDPTEVAVLGKIYSEGRKAGDSVWLSSVKSNMGHAESAAGIAGLLKVLLCFKNKSVPPHLHLKTLNPKIQLDSIPAKIPQELTKWEGSGRTAALSSFSMSGTNVHVIIEEAPEEFELLDQISTEPQVFKISAKSEAALEVYRSRYVEFAKKNPHANIRDIAYAMNVERASFPYRIALTATNMEEFGSKLEAQEFKHGKIEIRKPKIAFLFPGQGCQYFGMAQDLYKIVPSFASAWDKCNSSFSRLLGVSLLDVVWGEPHYLQNTQYCQAAIFCLQVAMTSMWNSFGIFPDLVLGHSLGENAAAVAAGILSFEDVLRLVVGRSALVSKLEDGAMVVVKVDEMTVRKLIEDFERERPGEWVDIAAINSSEEVVVSGNKDAILHFEQFSKAKKQVVKQLQASAAFHSRAMDPCLEDYGRIAEAITRNKHESKVIFISATRAMELTAEGFGPDYLKDHLRKPVKFSAAVKTMATHGCDIFLEIGPHPILIGLAMMGLPIAQNSDRVIFCPSMRKKEDNLKTLTMTLSKLCVAGADINWKNWFVSKRRHVELPFYPFQRSKFWYEQTSEDGDRQLSLNFNSPLLHPLLGRRVQVPGDIFCNWMNINDPSLAYLQDHLVGHKKILPGAAYLEVILSAAKQMGISGPLTIENFSIEAPLNLELDVTLYTVVNQRSAETGVYRVKIQRELGDGDVAGGKSWKLQAKATFRRPDGAFPAHMKNLEALKLQLPAWDELGVNKIYKVVSISGLQLGPEFTKIRHCWAGKQELLAEIEVPKNGFGGYSCHPVVLDTMLQTFAFMKFATENELDTKHMYLPVGIQTFKWFPRKMSSTVYAHILWNFIENNKFVITLYNSAGEYIAQMERPEIIQTSEAAFLRNLKGTEVTTLPQMWKAVWRPRTNSRQRFPDLLTLQMPSSSAPCVENLRRETVGERDKIMAGLGIDDIFIHVLLRTASELNWGLELGSNVKISKIRKTLSPEIQNLKALEYWMGILEKEGYLKEIPNSGVAEFEVTCKIPDITECNQNIIRITNEVTDKCKLGDAIISFAKRVEEKFTYMLQGKFEVQELLFPKDELEVGASRLYNDSIGYQLIRSYGVCAILDCVKSSPTSGVFRILEVGGGTGSATKQLLKEFVDLKLDVEYTFTDISPQFLSGAKMEFARFEGTSVSLDYNLFNIEDDPLGQGFHPEQYDLVVAFNVLHATRDLRETLSHLKTVLRPGGILIFSEPFRDFRVLSFSFGLLPDWWKYKDFRTSPVINGPTWVKRLHEAGFTEVSTIDELNSFCGVAFGRVAEQISSTQLLVAETYKMPTWLLFGDKSALCDSLAHKLPHCGRKVILVDQKIDTPELSTIGKQLENQNVYQLNPLQRIHFDSLFGYLRNTSTILEGIIYFSTTGIDEDTLQTVGKNGMDIYKIVPSGLLHLCQSYQAFFQHNPIRVATRLIGVTSGVHHVEVGGSPGTPNNSSTWSLLTSFLNENPALPVSLLDFDQEGAGGDELKVAQIMSKLWAKNNEAFTHFAGLNEFNLRLNTYSNQQSELKLDGINQEFEVVLPDSKSIQDIQIKSMETTPSPSEGEVEVEIKVTGFNFRDLFMIFQPDLPQGNSKGIGLDISGVIRSVGPGTKYVPGDEVISLRPTTEFKSHLVLPAKEVVYKPKNITFVEAASLPCAFISAYESLARISNVKSSDSVLIHVATGGLGLACIQIAKETGATIFATAGSKRERAYLRGLGISHVYSSMNTEFGAQILKGTEGNGVTVVINSLSTPGFKETSLRICAKGATFVEHGKVDVWTIQEASRRRPDVKYALFETLALPAAYVEELWNELLQKFESGTYKPIPATQFPLTHLKEALNYFKGEKHIGQVVIKMPERSSDLERNVWKQKMFNDQSTYLITGGLGGLGMEVTKWMLSSGAKNVVLIGRSQPTPEAQSLINSWNTAGANIQVFQVDVSDYISVANLLKRFGEEFPPLRGIFHAAGTLSDDEIRNQTTEKFEEIFRPKVIGTWNLHLLTVGYPLEFFINFSSCCSVFAIIGQSNYAAGNLYMDSLMNYRLASGLPGLTINWGIWSDVGVASQLALGQEGNFGLIPFSPKQGISALEYIMANQLHQIIPLQIGNFSQLKAVAPLGGNFYDEVKEDVTTVEKEQKGVDAQLIQAIHSTSSAEEAAPLIQNYIETLLKETLGMKKDEKIDPDQTWGELGVDSLMILEMRNRIQTNLLQEGRVISIMAMQENVTLKNLSATVGKLVSDFGSVAHDHS